MFGVFIFIVIEVILNAVDNVSYQLLTDEAKIQYDIDKAKPFTQSELYKKWIFKISALKPIEDEKDIQLDPIDYESDIRHFFNIFKAFPLTNSEEGKLIKFKKEEFVPFENYLV